MSTLGSFRITITINTGETEEICLGWEKEKQKQEQKKFHQSKCVNGSKFSSWAIQVHLKKI